MSEVNHRRKAPRHHKAYFAWTGNNEYRRMEWGKFRSKERDCLKTECYDDLPEKMLPTAWYYMLWY